MQATRASHLVLLSMAAFGLLSIAPRSISVDLAMGGRAALAQPAPITIENLKIPGSVYSFSIPRLTITGSSLSKEELQKLFDGSSADALSQRLSKLNFTEATAPEVIIDSQFGASSSHAVYKDVKLSNVAFGNIGDVTSSGASLDSISSMEVAGQRKQSNIVGTIGPIAVTGLDLVGLVKVFGESAEADNLPMFTLYKSYRVDSMMVSGTIPDGTLRLSSGRIEGRDFKARPGRTPFSQAFAILQAHPDLGDATDGDRLILFKSLVQFLQNFDYGSFSAHDFDVSMRLVLPNAGSAPDAPTAIHYTIGAIEFSSPERRLMLSNLDFDSPKDHITLHMGHYGLSGFSFAPSLETLGAMVDNETISEEDFKAADPRDFIPTLGAISVSDVKVTNEEPSQSFTLGEMKLEFADQLRGIPTKIAYALSHVVVDLPADSKDAQLQELYAAGLKRIDFSTALALKWNEASKTIDLGAIHFDTAGMGSVDFAGTIGNVQQELFTTSLSTAQILALAMTAKDAMLTVKDEGGLGIVTRIAVAQEKKSPEQLKSEFLNEVRTGLKQVFGDAPEVKTVVDAVEKFLVGGKTLSIKAKAKNDLGLGFMDFVAAQKPAEVLKKLTIEADAR